PHWLRGARPRNGRKPRARYQRRFLRPYVEQLEQRNPPGSLLGLTALAAWAWLAPGNALPALLEPSLGVSSSSPLLCADRSPATLPLPWVVGQPRPEEVSGNPPAPPGPFSDQAPGSLFTGLNLQPVENDLFAAFGPLFAQGPLTPLAKPQSGTGT